MDDKTSLYIDNDTRVAPLKETLLEPSNLESLPLSEVCFLLNLNVFMFKMINICDRNLQKWEYLSS